MSKTETKPEVAQEVKSEGGDMKMKSKPKKFKTEKDKPFKVDLSKVDTSLEANAKVEEPIKVDLTKTKEDNAIPIGETETVDVGERAGDGEKVDTGGDKSNEESSSPIEEIQEMAEEPIPAEQTIIDEVSPNTSHLPENIEKLVEFMIVETSSMISLLTKIDPNNACSASRLDGCFLSKLLFVSLIFSTN